MKFSLIPAACAALTLGLSAPAIACHDDEDHGGHRGGKMFERADADHDGVVTRAEADAFHEKKFNKMDLDGNGEITREEADQAHEKMREKWKEKHGHEDEHHEGSDDH